MKQHLIFACILLLKCSAIAGSRDSLGRTHTIALYFGANQLRDENLSPKVSTGYIAQLEYGFEQKRTAWHQFHFNATYSRLKTKVEDLPKSMNIGLRFNYSLAYCLACHKKFSYYFGPEANLAYNLSFYPNWDDSHLYWANFLGLGINHRLLLQLKNNYQWYSTISIPILSIYSRPDLYRLYKIDKLDVAGVLGNLHSHIRPGFWESIFNIRFQTEFSFPVFKNSRQSIIYSFEYLRMKRKDSNEFSQLSHQIGIRFYL